MHATSAHRSPRRAVGTPAWSTSTSTDWRSVLYEEYVSASVEDADVEPLDDYSVVVVTGGSAHIESWNGRSWTQGHCGTSSVGLTPPERGARLRWRNEEVEPLRTAHLFVPRSLVIEIADDLGVNSAPDGLPNALDLDDAMVHTLVAAIGRSARSHDPQEEYALSATHFLITHLLARLGAPRQSTSQRELQRLKHVLHDAAFLRTSTDALAAEAGLSEARLRRLVRDVTGHSLHLYLEAIRLAEACRLLEWTTKSMTQISEQCAFASPSHFAARFRRRYGTTPSAWRADHRA